MKTEYISKTSKIIYYGILTLLFILLVFIPVLVDDGFWFFAEEVVEAGLIVFVFAFIFFVHYFVENEIDKREKKLQDLYKEFGRVNIQISQINDIFSSAKKLPENKKDIKFTLKTLSNKMLSIVAVDWVVLRIIDLEDGRTLAEEAKARGPAVVIKHEIGNKDLLNKSNIDGCVVFSSKSQNSNIKTFCVLPTIKYDSTTKTFIISLLNYIDMIYVIFSSKRFKQKT